MHLMPTMSQSTIQSKRMTLQHPGTELVGHFIEKTAIFNTLLGGRLSTKERRFHAASVLRRSPLHRLEAEEKAVKTREDALVERRKRARIVKRVMKKRVVQRL
ncbi:hypothetical protein Ancab_023795 [Ancistrocladus abbreviatus]